jgi:hypothetical protein
MSKPQCPVTCHDWAIRPPRPGASSRTTKQLPSARSVLAQQVGYQTSFLLSSAAGSHELSGAPLSKVQDGIPCRLVEPSSTLHPLRLCRSSNRTDWRDPRRSCMPIPPPPTTLGRADNCTTAGRQLSPYRSRGSPTRQLPPLSDARRARLSRLWAALHSLDCLVCRPHRVRQKLEVDERGGVSVPPLGMPRGRGRILRNHSFKPLL